MRQQCQHLGDYLTLGHIVCVCGLVGWALADGGVMAAAHRCPITCIDVPVVSHGNGMPHVLVPALGVPPACG